jgi:hypothetical protein
MAYPIYLTIGNIPKRIRRKPSRMAQTLIGYIPTTKLLGLTNKSARRRALANLFHACMREALRPIIVPGEYGVAMKSGDGVWRRCHPIFANFIGDYPEQCLVTCTFNRRCPKCNVPPDKLGEYQTFLPRLHQVAIDTYSLANEDVHVFHSACCNTGLKPVYHPFWELLPFTDIFISITPDVLHQMLQGMMKHLIKWLVIIFGPTEIDARCRAMTPNHKTLLFAKGIATLSRVSGHEHKKMCCILMGLIVDLPLPGGWDPTRLVRAVRALLDFLYLAQYQCHTSDTLIRLHDALAVFHNNKAIFTDLGARENFNLPKLHSLTHYMSSISLFGTTDNYNTEQSERLHIDFAKDAYRATNRKDVYTQMTTWLQRREKILIQTSFITWSQHEHSEEPRAQRIPEPPGVPTQAIKMARHPTRNSVTFDVLARNYGAVDFQDALGDYFSFLNHPEHPRRPCASEQQTYLSHFAASQCFITSSSPSVGIPDKLTYRTMCMLVQKKWMHVRVSSQHVSTPSSSVKTVQLTARQTMVRLTLGCSKPRRLITTQGFALPRSALSFKSQEELSARWLHHWMRHLTLLTLNGSHLHQLRTRNTVCIKLQGTLGMDEGTRISYKLIAYLAVCICSPDLEQQHRRNGIHSQSSIIAIISM